MFGLFDAICDVICDAIESWEDSVEFIGENRDDMSTELVIDELNHENI